MQLGFLPREGGTLGTVSAGKRTGTVAIDELVSAERTWKVEYVAD